MFYSVVANQRQPQYTYNVLQRRSGAAIPETAKRGGGIPSYGEPHSSGLNGMVVMSTCSSTCVSRRHLRHVRLACGCLSAVFPYTFPYRAALLLGLFVIRRQWPSSPLLRLVRIFYFVYASPCVLFTLAVCSFFIVFVPFF